MANYYTVNLRGNGHTHQYWGNQRNHNHTAQGRFLVAAKNLFRNTYNVPLNQIHHSNLRSNNPNRTGTQVPGIF